MLKKYAIFCFLLLISFFSNAQSGWINQKFDNNVTVSFPSEIKKVNENTYMAKDSAGTVFAVMLIDIDKSSYHEPNAVDSLLIRIRFIDQVVNDIKAKMPTYAIGDIKISQLNNIKTYTLEGTNAENKSNVYINIFLVGDTSYSLTCFTAGGTDPKNKDAFFRKFVVSK